MTVRRLAEVQPESFAFTPESWAKAERELAKYPEGRQHSAIIGLLWLAQLQHDNWLPEPAIRHVADILEMPYIRALEVATFYTMFNLSPVGRKAHIQVCGTTPCMLRGAEDLKQICRDRIHPEQHHLSADGEFSWVEVECAGACVNAPMIQIDSDTYEDLTPDIFNKLIDDIAAGRPLKPGPQIDRQFSEPFGGATSLTEKVADRSDKRGPAGLTDQMAKRPSTVGDFDEKPARQAKPYPLPPAAKADDPEARDDLKQISGVGPKLEQKLNELGIHRFEQIAAWTPGDVTSFDDKLSFHGRIDRDDWIGQAKVLAAKVGKEG